jgi:hypothetical protein
MERETVGYLLILQAIVVEAMLNEYTELDFSSSMHPEIICRSVH